LGLRVSDLGFGVYRLGLEVLDLGFDCFRIRVQGSGFRVKDLKFTVGL